LRHYTDVIWKHHPAVKRIRIRVMNQIDNAYF